MKLRWAVGIGLWIASAAQAQPLRHQVEIRDSENKLYAVAVICDDCKTESKSGKCAPGAADGWAEGKPCGSCLMKSNDGTVIKYPHDLHFAGKLVDSKGKPVVNRFVKMLLPNGWGIRTKTGEGGGYRLMLGATEERKPGKPILTDLGTRVDSKTDGDEHFAVYLLPPNYSPCAGPEPDKPEKKPKLRTKAQ